LSRLRAVAVCRVQRAEVTTPSLRELIEEMGPALEPRLALEVARGVLASLDDGPFDTPPAERLAPEEVAIESTPNGVRVSFLGNVRIRAVGELLYIMLAGGPLRGPKDPPDRKPRPLAKLRAFLGGGPMPAALEPLVTDLLEERFETAERAMDALDAVRIG
jgi:hypothetical protein